MALRCLIVDDSAGFLREACELLEEEGIDVVGIASNGEEAVRQTWRLAPDVVLVDIDLGGESGIATVRRLIDDDDPPEHAVILISSHDPQEFAELVAASPAIGFIAKADLGAQAITALLDARESADLS